MGMYNDVRTLVGRDGLGIGDPEGLAIFDDMTTWAGGCFRVT